MLEVSILKHNGSDLMDPSATKWHSACGARSTPNKYIQKIQTQNKTKHKKHLKNSTRNQDAVTQNDLQSWSEQTLRRKYASTNGQEASQLS